MNCIKCGKQVSEGQVFCDECLQDMQHHPVKPGTPVILPNRPSTPAPKRRHTRKARKPEEQVRALKTTVTWLALLLAVVTLLLALCVFRLIQTRPDNVPGEPPGQNYSTTDSASNEA